MKKWLFVLAMLPVMAFADELNGGDTAWMLVATAFVMLMTPAGLALYYGGLTRSKNVLNTMGMSLASFAVGILVWVVIGYSIAFGDGDLIGTDKVLLAGIHADSLSGTVVHINAGVAGALIIGLVGGFLGFLAVAKIKKAFKVDDSLDAFWVHGLVGIWGSIATAVFIADYAVPENYHMVSQLGKQLMAVGLTIVYSAVMTAVIYFVSSAMIGGGRVDEETETMGLDEAVHGERGLNM